MVVVVVVEIEPSQISPLAWKNGALHCKWDTWHDPDGCFELSKNKDKRRTSWKSVFDTGNLDGGTRQ